MITRIARVDRPFFNGQSQFLRMQRVVVLRKSDMMRTPAQKRLLGALTTICLPFLAAPPGEPSGGSCCGERLAFGQI